MIIFSDLSTGIIREQAVFEGGLYASLQVDKFAK